MNLYEAVGLAKIGGLHYLLMAYSATGNLGDRHDQRHLGHRHGMYTFTAESPEGPFRPDTEAYPLLVSNPQPGLRPMTFCARFYPTPDETLVHHHSVARSGLVWFSPLKKAVVDGGGHLRLGYWRGNDALKGAPIGIDLTCCSRVHPTADHPDGRLPPTEFTSERNTGPRRLEISEANGRGLLPFANHFDLEQGVVLEGALKVHEPPKRWSGVGLFVEEEPYQNRGTAILAQTRGRTEIGVMTNGINFRPDDVTERGIALGKRSVFRLLVRRSLMEFYIDDLLVQCYSLPEAATGRLGLVFESGRAVFEDVKAWAMK